MTDPPPAGLRQVRWLGGAPGAGKTTVARLLAARDGLRVYDTDEAMSRHARSLSADEAPRLAAFSRMTMDERWCDRSPTEMLETFHWFRGEGCGRIVADLAELPNAPVVAEGFRLLPHLVRPHAAPGRAVWLLPTPAFRRAAHEERGSLWEIAGRTTRPGLALANLLERDRLFTERLRDAVHRLDLPSIDVEVGATADQLADRVADRLGLGPA